MDTIVIASHAASPRAPYEGAKGMTDPGSVLYDAGGHQRCRSGRHLPCWQRSIRISASNLDFFETARGATGMPCSMCSSIRGHSTARIPHFLRASPEPLISLSGADGPNHPTCSPVSPSTVASGAVLLDAPLSPSSNRIMLGCHRSSPSLHRHT